MQMMAKRTGAFALTALTAAVWLFVGCKKDAAVVDLGSNPATDLPDETTALSASEQCFADCDAQHAASTQLFDDMDLCVDTQCKLAFDDPPFSPKACAPIDNKVITYNYDEVDNCLASLCCDKVTACANDPDCAAASSCYDSCVALELADTTPDPTQDAPVLTGDDDDDAGQ